MAHDDKEPHELDLLFPSDRDLMTIGDVGERVTNPRECKLLQECQRREGGVRP